MLTPKQIFMLGWHEYYRKQTLSALKGGHAPLLPPTDAEIDEIITDFQPPPIKEKKPPFDQADMKEYPIG